MDENAIGLWAFCIMVFWLIYRNFFWIWVCLSLLGLWSCVGVIYRNSRKTTQQIDEIIALLKQIADRKQ